MLSLAPKRARNLAIIYLDEHEDANETRHQVEEENRRCLTIAGDVGNEQFCRQVVQKSLDEFQQIDVLINNAAVQFPQEDMLNISAQQLEMTFRTNIFSYFYMTIAAVPHLKEGSAIINTTSVTAYRGSEHLVDYASTKGAIVAFTRSLALNLAPKKIRSQRRGPRTHLDPADPGLI